ncbi:elongation factor P 5-aminopentanone reductase [Companilactobacillus sp. DQM5]|uniref:elongation factor P 5-aminopentanone reductase n=1 Tax=Companilactobacillus sp. DQM5 TaxID=3463359 RepID=UPI004058B6F0
MNKKYALVVGASGDIGESIAAKLANSGWSLYLHYNNGEEKITKLISELVKNYPEQDFFSIKANLITDSIDVISEKIFALNAIVFAQGITEYGLFTSLTDIRMQELIKVNYEKPLLLVKKLQDKISNTGFGRIIFLSSVYGKIGSPMEVMYSSLKGAISSFANAYAKEVASLGITVNAIAPGAVKTNMTKDFTEEEIKDLNEQIPVGKMAKPKDISFWVDILMKKEAEYMTGETIYIDGGWLF